MTFEEFIKEWHNEDDFIRVKTSGSTGTPKWIKLTKAFVKESAERTNSFFNINSGSRLHSCVAADFIGGKMMAVRADISGASFTCETPSNLPLKELKKEDTLDLLAVVPSQMIKLLDEKEDLPKINNIIVGGSSIHPALRVRIAESGFVAYETYGMTETASHIALRRIKREENPFELLPGIKIEYGQDNCLRIKFYNGIEVNTNDIVEIISDTQFYVKGRKDNVIISGGKKLNPEELEKRIANFINGEFYLKGEPDEKWGERLVLVIEGKREDFDEEIIKKRIKEELSSWEIPKEIKYQEKLTRTQNGKIKRP